MGISSAFPMGRMEVELGEPRIRDGSRELVLPHLFPRYSDRRASGGLVDSGPMFVLMHPG